MSQSTHIERFHFVHQRIFGGLRRVLETFIEFQLFPSFSRVAVFPVGQPKGVVRGCIVLEDPAGPPIPRNRRRPVSAGGEYAAEAQVRRRQARILPAGSPGARSGPVETRPEVKPRSEVANPLGSTTG